MSDIPTYHRGATNYGTGYDMMKRIRDLQAEVARLREALQGVADYSTIPSKDFRKRHPEFAAAMRAEEKRYGLEFLPELALSRKARAALEDTP